MICAWVRPSCFATPATRAVKSTKYPALAEEFCASSLRAEPVASIAALSPILSSSPNAMASLPIWSTAPCPRSSPRATLILSAASTNSSMELLDVIPSRPAAPANSLSCSREVLVSIFLKSSFMDFTSSFVWPVYFITFVMASSISAKSLTHFLIVIVNPEKEAIICVKAPQFLLSIFMNLDHLPVTASCSLPTAASCVLTLRICSSNLR